MRFWVITMLCCLSITSAARSQSLYDEHLECYRSDHCGELRADRALRRDGGRRIPALRMSQAPSAAQVMFVRRLARPLQVDNSMAPQGQVNGVVLQAAFHVVADGRRRDNELAASFVAWSCRSHRQRCL